MSPRKQVFHQPNSSQVGIEDINRYKQKHLKTFSLQQQNKFLRGCREDLTIPNAISLSYQLTTGCNDESLVRTIQSILDEATSRILDNLISFQESLHAKHLDELQSSESDIYEKYGKNVSHAQINKAKQVNLLALKYKENILKKKRSQLATKQHSSWCLMNGSRKVTSNKYVKPKESQICKSVRISRQNRSKRRRKIKNNIKCKTNSYKITDEDIQRLNPENLTDNVELTETDKSVLRLSDKFAMTPKDPLDVSDMAVGAYKWAESIRWTVFWHNWRKNKPRKRVGYEDLTQEDYKEFEETPWYKKQTDLHLQLTQRLKILYPNVKLSFWILAVVEK